ncbi:MAG: SIMPL domain-containing protein, partial [Pseudomonadota bacterium]
VLDDLVRAGSNEINGISFEVDAPEPLLDQARAAAVRDARRKATLMVEAAGETLGPLLEIREAGVSAPPMPFARAETAMMSDMPIARGETDLTARVTLVFALSD